MPSDEAEFALLRAKAEAGDAEAQNDLGRAYAEGRGVPPDPAAAREWFLAAARQGLPRAKHNLGTLAFYSGREADLDEAIAWFEQAAADGWLNSMTALGLLHKERQERSRAMYWLEQAAQRGDPVAQDGLSRLYLEREDDPASLALAKQWAQRAADQGYPHGQAQLGTIYHEGLGVDRDPELAFAWFMKAALAGLKGAQLFVGVAYDLGTGVTADKVEAFVWLTRSARNGEPWASAYLRRIVDQMSPSQIAEAKRRLDPAS